MHNPVLLQEAIRYLEPDSNRHFIDCTVGRGGHAFEILRQTAPEGRVLGIDWDGISLEALRAEAEKRHIAARLVLAEGNYADLETIAERYGFMRASGVLIDLGVSSWQLEASGRGFSFLRDEPLDMRFSRETIRTAADIVNKSGPEEIARILQEYGEERAAVRIARVMVAARRSHPLKTSAELADIVRSAVPPRHRRGRIHPATRTFQALRIAVNNELGNLRAGLAGALKALELGGRIVVISFHSLEDRIVKNFFREQKKACTLSVLTRKPVAPSADEIRLNPRARSAKLRAAMKT